MNRNDSNDNRNDERRTFLKAWGLGAVGLAVTAGLLGRESEAAEYKYSRADIVKVNGKLKKSAKEREAFYKDPEGYLKRHGITMPKDMIPSRTEVEAALTGKPGELIGGGKAMGVHVVVSPCAICTGAAGSGISKKVVQPAPLKKTK